MIDKPTHRPLDAPMPIQRRKLSDDAALQIEQMIQDGRLPPGTLLPPERQLMAMFGVGRTSIREALFALNRMGLVQVRNGERPRVTAPTPEKLIAELSGAVRYFLLAPHGAEKFQEVRELFEIGVARIAAERRTDEDLLRLGEALEANVNSSGDVRRFEQTDVAFHYALAVVTQNPILVAVHDALVEWLTSQRTLALRHPDAERLAIEGHRRVFEAVRDRNPEEAGKAMEDHLKSIADLIASFARSEERMQEMVRRETASGSGRRRRKPPEG
jgi:GntR family transcriptional repressor for pyruvate dehydrogenase complex